MFIRAENKYIFPGLSGSKQPKLLVIIDEYSMVTSSQLDTLLEKARRVFKNVQLVLFGDHHQLPPVGGMSPWLSKHLRAAMASTQASALAVYELRQQKRFRHDRVEVLVHALLNRRFSTANAMLFEAAARSGLPAKGTCPYFAYRNAELIEWNSKSHERLAALPGANETTFRTAKGDPAPSFKLVNGTEVTCKENTFTKDEKLGIVYSEFNGLTGKVIGLTGGIQVIHETTTIKLRLENGDLHLMSPKMMPLGRVRSLQAKFTTPSNSSDGAESAPPPAKKRRRDDSNSMVWWFNIHQGPAKTIHLIQGLTLPRGQKVVINVKGLSGSLGYYMLYVAASRVQQFADLYIIGYEKIMDLKSMALACRCGCSGRSKAERRKLSSIEHSEAKLTWLHRWEETLLARRRVIYEVSPAAQPDTDVL